MADSIGGVNFFRIDGEPPGYGTDVEDISRPYEDGNAFRRTGKKAEGTILIGQVDLVSAAAVWTFRQATLPALRGTLVALVQRGQSTPNLIFRRFKVDFAHPCARILGGVNVPYGNAGYWVQVSMEVQPAGAPS